MDMSYCYNDADDEDQLEYESVNELSTDWNFFLLVTCFHVCQSFQLIQVLISLAQFWRQFISHTIQFNWFKMFIMRMSIEMRSKILFFEFPLFLSFLACNLISRVLKFRFILIIFFYPENLYLDHLIIIIHFHEFQI